VMLTGLKAPLKEGETVTLTLTFEKAGEIKTDAPVVDIKSIPAASHEHMEN
jgi:copper(I)-binding protein